MSDAALPGYYGKLPCLGDFVTRRVPRSLVDPWDVWLQGGLAASRAQLGETWADVYLTSPLWRFVIGRDACGPAAWLGVMSPSVDRVGRCFPFAVFAPVATATLPLVTATRAQDWLARVEALVLSLLDAESFDDAAVDRALAELGDPGDPGEDGPALAPPPTGSPWRLPLPAVDGVALRLPAVAAALAGAAYGPHSVWWSAGSQRIAPSLALCSALPAPDAFVAMLDGGWQDSGWLDAGPAPAPVPAP